jgi:hypothetical protein
MFENDEYIPSSIFWKASAVYQTYSRTWDHKKVEGALPLGMSIGKEAPKT